MSIEKPKLSSESQEYRYNLAGKIKDARKADEKAKEQYENSGIFKKPFKKIFKKDGRITAPEMLDVAQKTDEYKNANEEQKEVRERLLVINKLEEGSPYQYVIIQTINLVKEQGIETDIPKESYEKGVINSLEVGNLGGAKEIINFAKEQGVGIDWKDIPKESYEKAVISILEEGSPDDIKQTINLVKEQGIEINIPKESYEKGVINSLEVGYLGVAEKIINFAKEQGVEVDWKDIPKESYEKAVISKLEGRLPNKAEDIINLVNEQGIEIDIPKESYEKAFMRQLERVRSNAAEQVVNFAKKQGVELKFKDEIPVLCYLKVIHNKNLGHVEHERRVSLEGAEKYGMTYEKAVLIDWADYLDVPEEQRMDLSIDKGNYQIIFKGIKEEDGSAEGKHILGTNKEGRDILLFDNTLGEHKDIAFKYEIIPGGGGRIKFDQKNKKIEVYGESKSFGKEDRDKTLEFLKNSFEGYEVIEG